MDASKVKFFSQTKEALSNPGLDAKKKRQLKIERVKSYIRSKPVGTKFRLLDLISVAGYRVEDKKAYAAGYAFVKALDGREITIEETPKLRKSVVVLKDDTVHTVVPAKPREEAQDKDPEDRPAQGTTEPPIIMTDVDVLLVREIERLAKAFAWKNDSNDLREFVRSLK